MAALILVLASSPSAKAAPEKPITEEEARVALSALLRSDKRFLEAAREYAELIKKFPDRTELRVELAELYAAVGSPEEAWSTLQPVSMAQLDDRGQLLRANIAMQRKDFSLAIDTLKIYLARRPNDATARLQLADALSWEKRYSESSAEFERLIDERPDDVQLRRRYARMLGWAGRNADAVKQWKISLAEDGGVR